MSLHSFTLEHNGATQEPSQRKRVWGKAASGTALNDVVAWWAVVAGIARATLFLNTKINPLKGRKKRNIPISDGTAASKKKPSC